MNRVFVLVIAAEFWMTVGQIFFKQSANRLNVETKRDQPWIIGMLGCILKYPVLWLGAASMLGGLLFWFAALASGDLSLVYLLGSIQYIFALIAAHFFLQEKINAAKLAGTLLIMLGVILTAAS
jgi:drug/metabolite transporter (DMT)-like permease